MSIKTQIENLRLPLFAGPMFLLSGPELVINSCKAGIIGAFPSPNARTTEILDEWLTEIRSALQSESNADWEYAPYAANLVVHSTNKRFAADLALVVKHQSPIVITALGSPARVVEPVHEYGGLVFADVNSVEYARKAAATGVDGLVLVCSGAGGHTGAINSFAFVTEVRKFFDGYIALAGGIASGDAILASIAAGADFAYMGTSFIATEESLAEPEYKQMAIECTAEDLLVSKAFTGANASMMIPSIINAGLDPVEVANQAIKLNYNPDEEGEKKAWKGIWSAGQGVGSVEKVLSVADLVAQLESEFFAAKKRAGFD